MSTLWEVVKIIICFVLPPLAVAIEEGVLNKHFWINIILTCLGMLRVKFAHKIFRVDSGHHSRSLDSREKVLKN